MIERGRLQEGETVLVSGSVGRRRRWAGADRPARGCEVLGITSESKVETVREAGAPEVIDRAGKVAEQIRGAAPEDVDVALDVVAGELVSDGLPLCTKGPGGSLPGALGGYEVTFDVRRLHLHNAQVNGSAMHTPAHFDLLMDPARHAEVSRSSPRPSHWARPLRRRKNSSAERTWERSSCA